MKRILLSFLSALPLLSGLQAAAQDFTVPEGEMLIPLHGQAQLLSNWVQVTWGYYPITQVAGKSITATVTTPEGEVMTVSGKIQDANAEGTQEREVPTTVRNSLAFSGFQTLNWDTMTYEPQLYGTWNIEIPAGIVRVNGVLNPAFSMDFKITGVPKTMPLAEVVFPLSQVSSSVSSVQLMWEDPVTMVDNVRSVDIPVAIDGMPSKFRATGRLMTVVDTGENDNTMTEVQVFHISTNFITYNDGTTVDFLIPEGIVQNEEGEVNESQTVTFFLYPLAESVFTPEEGTTLGSADAEMTITWPGAISVERNFDNNMPIIARLSDRTSEDLILTPMIPEEGDFVILDLGDLPEGRCEIVIPEGYFLITLEDSGDGTGKAMNYEILVNYMIGEETGTEIILKDSVAAPAYNLQGQPVKEPRKGIVIINGKKVVL